jgi:hypothetical protein
LRRRLRPDAQQRGDDREHLQLCFPNHRISPATYFPRNLLDAASTFFKDAPQRLPKPSYSAEASLLEALS